MQFKEQLLRALKFILILCAITISIQIVKDGTLNVAHLKAWVFSNFFFGLPFYFANAYLNDGLDKLYSWFENPKKRALVGIPAFMILNISLMLLLIYIYSIFYLGIENPNLLDRRNIDSIIIALTICLVATLFFHALGFFNGYISQLKISKKLREEKVTAELNALKAQVNPHFLFNSFNVLSGLIDEDPPKAQKFLSGLSKIYRYILENRNEDLSTLSEELDFTKQYFKLQQTRFEDSIQMSIDVPEKVMDKKLPSLSLQLLLENAIKHNRFDNQAPLKIAIYFEKESLIITNNKKERRNLESNNGVGLANIKQRYQLHQVMGFEIEDKEDSFTLRLPLI